MRTKFMAIIGAAALIGMSTAVLAEAVERELAAPAAVSAEHYEPEYYIAPEPEITTSGELFTEPEPLPMSLSASGCLLNVEPVLQNPDLPTGCEVTALAAVLRYYGFDADKIVLFDGYMPQAEMYEATFFQAFVGDPRTPWGYGCFSPVVTETARRYFAQNGINRTACDISGAELSDLFEYIRGGDPVIVWISMDLRDITWDSLWTAPDGSEAWFPSGEHCVVLTGFDEENGIVYTADPMNGSAAYPLDRFNEIYDKMKKQAVIIGRV